MPENRPSVARHTSVGRWGEQIAVDTLVADGYAIVERNWRSGHLELDIIARKDNVMVFVEVKTRSADYADAVSAVDMRKRNRMVRSADTYLRMQPHDYDFRFDIIAINGTPEEYTVEHIPDAFLPSLRHY